jgi:hypothetical protein
MGLFYELVAASGRPRRLRPAEEAQGVVATETAADVQQRRRLVEDAAVVAPAVAARHEDRTDQRQPNLPAVDVAG